MLYDFIMKKFNFQLNLPITFLREGATFIAYTPALDLSTSGRSFEEARRRFVEAALIFFEEIINKGTLDDVLGSLGWQKVESKWQPPVVISQESEVINVLVHV